MNEHILFVIDRLANPDKYTQLELEANKQSARADDACWDADAADYAYWAAVVAACGFSAAAVVAASYWVDEYFVITGEDKQTYIDKLGE